MSTQTPPANVRLPLRVVLADDAYFSRVALKHLLEGAPMISVVAECEDGAAVPDVVDRQRADLLISDIRMPPGGDDEGIRLAARLRTTHPALGVIVLSTYAEVDYALRLFEDGCDGRGYLLKDRIRDRRQVLQAAVTVASGGSVIDPKIVEDLVDVQIRGGSSPLAKLSARELETLALIAEGYSNSAIAERMTLTKRAVEKHVNAIFAKCELGDPDQFSRRVKAVLLYLSDRRPAAPGVTDA